MAGYSLWGLYDQSHDQSDSGCMHHTYIQNLGKQYWWTYLQRRNGDADVGNGLVDTAGEGEARTNWEGSIDVYTLTHSQSHSDVSDSLRPHGLQPARLLCPWDFPGKNTGVGCHSLLWGIFPTQRSNPDCLHCRQILYCLSHQGSPINSLMRIKLFFFQKCQIDALLKCILISFLLTKNKLLNKQFPNHVCKHRACRYLSRPGNIFIDLHWLPAIPHSWG